MLLVVGLHATRLVAYYLHRVDQEVLPPSKKVASYLPSCVGSWEGGGSREDATRLVAYYLRRVGQEVMLGVTGFGFRLLIRHNPLPGPYSRTAPRVLWWF